MNRRNIARLSNGSQFPITIVCSAPSALLTSPAWSFFSSLRREVSSHLSGVRYFVRVLRPWGLPHPLDVRCFARLLRPWGLPHPLDVKCSYVHLAIWALLTSSAWGIRLITHPFSVSWSTFFVATWSRLISEVKHGRARLVRWWETTLEVRVSLLRYDVTVNIWSGLPDYTTPIVCNTIPYAGSTCWLVVE